MAEDIYEISMLLDFYGQLLTDNQYMCMDMYYNQDLSLSEIADEIEISRQGVHDFIKRGRAILADYEKKLGLMARFCEIKKNLKNIQEDLQLIDRSDLNSGNFMISTEGENITFTVKGIGAGYGMSLYTARQKAAAGAGYEEILYYFYKNIELTSE